MVEQVTESIKHFGYSVIDFTTFYVKNKASYVIIKSDVVEGGNYVLFVGPFFRIGPLRLASWVIHHDELRLWILIQNVTHNLTYGILAKKIEL